MKESILQIDSELFLYLNSLHSPNCDLIMSSISGTKIWIPLYAVILIFIFKKYQWKQGLLFLSALISLIILTDQSSVHLFKNVFLRLRPCFSPSIETQVHCPHLPGGRYGFISSHAANTFGFALLSSLILKKKTYSIFIFFWATLVSYSRIYLGVHYPGDIFCGALWGLFCAMLIFYGSQYIRQKLFSPPPEA
ncbi:MAG: phosphatase PAP2 family protein [Bacteroidia bacterium]|nr:MAG: phosphatase PAP2 family protein [Bacteroidia bacterium]